MHPGIVAVFLVSLLSLAGCFGEPLDLNSVTGKKGMETGAALAMGTLVSEDLTCVTAGVLAGRGTIPFGVAGIGCIVGILLGDLVLYGLGAVFGKRMTHSRWLNWWISEKRLESGAALFERHGGKLVFSSRFLPGTRVPVYVAAGMLGYPLPRFALFMAIAVAIWTPALVGFSMVLGDGILDWLGAYQRMAFLSFLAVVLLIWAIVQLVVPLFSWRGRRLLLSKWRRLTEYEFWPMSVFYLPVYGYLLFLMWKHRSLTAFTAANTTMPHGGFALESKREILDSLAEPADGCGVAPFVSLSANDDHLDRWEILERFLETSDQRYPLVLKPDIGERGQGVAVVRDDESVQKYLGRCKEDVIAQKFAPGLEFGVFYYRRPDAEMGEIFSITEKKLLSVTGDGERTLEELILADDRAMRMARYFLKRFGPRIAEVPLQGESVPLTELGTHCRGALFLDASEHATPELRKTVDTFSKQFEGFHFGRYDLRVPSIDDLRGGRNLIVLELNGVSSESTNIYDPKHRIWDAWRTLWRQWEIAFEIGAANALRGGRQSESMELIKLIREHGRREWFEADED